VFEISVIGVQAYELFSEFQVIGVVMEFQLTSKVLIIILVSLLIFINICIVLYTASIS
jgi:hypothetical protein